MIPSVYGFCDATTQPKVAKLCVFSVFTLDLLQLSGVFLPQSSVHAWFTRCSAVFVAAGDGVKIESYE